MQIEDVNLLSLISGNFKKVATTSGGEYSGPCPQCGGTDRFRVWPHRQDKTPGFWCRGCGWKGNAASYVIWRDHLTDDKHGFVEALKTLGIELESNYTPRTPYKAPALLPPQDSDLSMSKITEKMILDFHNKGAGQAYEYFRRFKFEMQTVNRFKLGFAQFQSFSGYTIPRYYYDTPVGVKIRRKDVQPGDKNKYIALKAGLAGTGFAAGIFNTQWVTSPDGKHVGPNLPYCFIGEDEKSAMLLDQMGHPAVGYKPDAHWNSFLPIVFQNVGMKIILMDNDAPDKDGRRAGEEQALELKRNLQSRHVTILRLPPFINDIADFAEFDGISEVETWLNRQLPFLA